MRLHTWSVAFKINISITSYYQGIVCVVSYGPLHERRWHNSGNWYYLASEIGCEQEKLAVGEIALDLFECSALKVVKLEY